MEFKEEKLKKIEGKVYLVKTYEDKIALTESDIDREILSLNESLVEVNDRINTLKERKISMKSL
jgi:hypothetical protein